MAEYQLSDSGVIRESDGANIPASLLNRDWRVYQQWVESGGITDPAPIPPPKLPIADQVEAGIMGSPMLIALVRWIAKDKGITEAALITAVKAEARE